MNLYLYSVLATLGVKELVYHKFMNRRTFPFFLSFQDEWKEGFDNRNLNAYSVSPLFVYPTHYTGEPGYISDTEDSVIIIDDESQTTTEPELEDKGLGLEVGLNGLGKEEL